jgi:heptosyltransferase-2
MRAPATLVIVAPNWLGDAVMALPLINDLRRAWGATRIVVAARPSVAPVYTMVPAVDETVTLDRKTDVDRLQQVRADAALLLPNSFASAWLVRKAQIPERWGFARDLRGALLTQAIPRPRHYGHQVEYYQSLGAALGLEPGPPLAPLTVPEHGRQAAAALLAEHGVTPDRGVVVFAPGAAYGRAKQWLPARFAELAQRLDASHVATVLIGAKGDVTACDEVARAARVVNLAGRTDLVTVAGLLASSRAVVANDSGAMHLAAAVGVPVTAIFGPTDEHRTAPLRASAEAPAPTIVTATAWCRPCMLRECPIDHRCMTAISAAQVYETLEVALS